jgi:hypothetical protein
MIFLKIYLFVPIILKVQKVEFDAYMGVSIVRLYVSKNWKTPL